MTGLSAVVGHRDVIARLRASRARGRLAPAYLLHGEDGIGKRTVAEAWTRLLQCRAPAGDPAEAEACGACVSCRHHAAGTHPDVFRLVPAQEAATVAIDQIRELQAALSYQPLIASPRVVLIPDATLLRPDGANALLKTLEEPPAHALFIVMAPQRERLLPTIVSRCQAVRCSPPSQEAVIEHLTARLGLPAERARALFVQAQGRIGPAIQAASAPGEAAPPYEDVGSPSTIADPVRLLDLAQGIGKDQEALRGLLAWLTLWLRDVLAWRLTRDPDRVLHPDRRADLAWWADRLSTDDVLDLASGLHAVWTSVHRNLNPQLVAETALLHIAQRVNHPTPRCQEIA